MPEMDQLLDAARALGADAALDPDADPRDPRLQLMILGLVYGTAELASMVGTEDAREHGVADPLAVLNRTASDAAGVDDAETVEAWMAWVLRRAGTVAAQQHHPGMAAVATLITAAEAVLTASRYRRTEAPAAMARSALETARRRLAHAQRGLDVLGQ